ncbi:hypothetical protein EVAR_81149_1 [Eumeta japonica]|uniref:PiggyBac transposable element-derived protein domain-containing protein n=1 Tax=Eumeta variegata TaxID=151549 RepID=A0A4C1ULP3_EUMVA|nr:hypothetical protein EVAR_81149_1 [Eumeta japonica]
MSENARKHQLQSMSSSKSKILRADSPSFEEEFYTLMLASDQSDSEGDIDEFLVSDRELYFINNCQQIYELSECVTVDEMLVKFRGRSHLISYMPKKPGTDGVGLATQDQKLLVPTQCVLRLTQPIEGSNRNVTADNWFSSIELIDELAKRELTYPKIADRGDFLKSLARSLVLPQMQRRVVCSQLPRELRLVIKRVLGDDMIEEDVQSPVTSQGKRRACAVRPVVDRATGVDAPRFTGVYVRVSDDLGEREAGRGREEGCIVHAT